MSTRSSAFKLYERTLEHAPLYTWSANIHLENHQALPDCFSISLGQDEIQNKMLMRDFSCLLGTLENDTLISQRRLLASEKLARHFRTGCS